MRGFMLVIWLLVPVAFGAFHYGPGQERLKLDATQSSASAAAKQARLGNHAAAVDLYGDALSALPQGREQEAQRIRLERAKSQMLSKQLPAAYGELESLVTELETEPVVDASLLHEAREAQASAKYYVTWLMRLEGKPRSEWEPEIEASRQIFRLLAEQTEASGDEPATKHHQEDLEAAIRLARLDVGQLQALPLPCQCQGCCSGDCKGGNGKCKGKGKSMKKPKGKDDARGASSGPPPDETGN